MGNSDGILSSAVNQGLNEKIRINPKWHFSFAYGDEIALVGGGGYYILNCDIGLWKRVRAKLKQAKKIKDIKKWWKLQSEKHIISDWSDDFNDL